MGIMALLRPQRPYAPEIGWGLEQYQHRDDLRQTDATRVPRGHYKVVGGSNRY